MRANKELLFSLICAVFVLWLTTPAMAGRGCTTDISAEDFIVIEKTAPGTKYSATLTIYYDDNAICPLSIMTDMHFFMRFEGNMIVANGLASGAEIVSFAGIEECVPYWNGDGYTAEEATTLQQEAISEFFRSTVNPWVYFWNNPDDPDGCDPDAVDPTQVCPPFAIKSVGSIVEDFNLPISSGLLYMIMDLVIAIED